MCQLGHEWPVTIQSRTPGLPLPPGAETQPASVVSAGKLRRAIARGDVFAVGSRVERLSSEGIDEGEVKQGYAGVDKAGAQHVGTGMGLGEMKGRKVDGSSRRLAARRRVAVVKVIANATAKRS